MNANLKKPFLLSIIILLLFGCSSDEDVNNTSPGIIGTWAIQTIDPDISINGLNITNIPPALLGLNESESLLLSLLLAPNSSSVYQDFQFQFNEDNSLLILPANDQVDNATYIVINNDQLIISHEELAEEVVFEISNLTFNSLVLSLDQATTIDLNEDGVEENLNIKL